MRADGEDTTAQAAHLADARLLLAARLDRLAVAAHHARLTALRPKAHPQAVSDAVADVHGAASAVRRAEEGFDLAALDLRTASGEDA